MSRIYIASSWRNKFQPMLIHHLQEAGHKCYDFRNPPNKAGFKWKDIEEDWQNWTMEHYREILTSHPDAASGYTADYRAMQWADTCVLVLPSGRSSHLEAGYFNGANKQLIVFIPEPIEPDLMYLMAQHICLTMAEVINVLK